MRTPKFQVAAEQPLTGECWIPPQKDTPRSESVFRIKPHRCQRRLEGSDKTLCAPGPRDGGRPAFECPSVSWGGTGQQWPAVGAGALGAADLWLLQTSMWHKPSWRSPPIAPTYSCWADDPQTAEQLYQRNSHTAYTVLGRTTDFPIWGAGRGT